uniref:Uncharacterized protein n=1 Tax=Arundo donax TaxID=35708 RepID=A0A0A8YW57_ARUDO
MMSTSMHLFMTLFPPSTIFRGGGITRRKGRGG